MKYDQLKLKNQLCFPLYAASKFIIQQYKSELDPLDLTYTQYITMMVLWEVKQINVKELGKRLYLDSGTLSPVLKSLEKKGFILRSRSKKDERVVNIELTEEGDRLQEKAAMIPEKVGQCLGIEEEEAKTLYSLLYRILDHSDQTI